MILYRCIIQLFWFVWRFSIMSTTSMLLNFTCNNEYKLSEDNIHKIEEIFPDIPQFEMINILSSQYYEKNECKSKIVFVPSTYTRNVPLLVKYKKRVSLNKDSVRQITKFLASTNDEHALVMKYNKKNYAYEVIGVCDSQDTLDMSYSVRFNGHMHYSFYLGDQHILNYECGIYKVPKSNMDALYKFLIEIINVKKNCAKVFVEHVNTLIQAKHGTTMVFCTNACDKFYRKETARLVDVGRGVKIEPIDLFSSQKTKRKSADDFLKQTAVADGGFLIDFNGKCEAINVIFDGQVNSNWNDFVGSAARGSRFNSLLTYIHGKNTSCDSCEECKFSETCTDSKLRAFAIVISDDGMVNVIQSREGLDKREAMF